MPATKKRKTVKKTSPAVTKTVKTVEKNSDTFNMLLVVFSISMMAFAYVLYKVYVY